jgi:hypothetical protein
MDSAYGSASKEHNIALLDLAPHPHKQGSREVNSCDPKGFLAFHPISGKWSLNLTTTKIFSHLARETGMQHLLYGLTCTQNPKIFSEFRQDYTNSQVVKSNVRLPNQQTNKVVITV